MRKRTTRPAQESEAPISIASEDREQLDLRAEIARIDRDRAEIQKLFAEQPKLLAEHRKLVAEAEKLGRDARLFPWQMIVTVLGGAAACFAAGAAFVKAVGG